MSAMVNPMDAFPSFQQALDAGQINLLKGEVDPGVFAYRDQHGELVRYTYVRIDGTSVVSLAMLCPAERNKGLPCFQIAYAIPEHLRGQGRAKDIANAAIAELQNGLNAAGVESFYIEAVVSRDNIPSQRVAQAVVGGEARPMIDELSNTPGLQYMRLITSEE